MSVTIQSINGVTMTRGPSKFNVINNDVVHAYEMPNGHINIKRITQRKKIIVVYNGMTESEVAELRSAVPGLTNPDSDVVSITVRLYLPGSNSLTSLNCYIGTGTSFDLVYSNGTIGSRIYNVEIHFVEV